jgi:hypothetical protein
MANARSFLDLILRVRKQGKGGNEVEDELKGVEKQTKKTASAADQLQTAECVTCMGPYAAALRGLTRMARRGQDPRYSNQWSFT